MNIPIAEDKIIDVITEVVGEAYIIAWRSYEGELGNGGVKRELAKITARGVVALTLELSQAERELSNKAQAKLEKHLASLQAGMKRTESRTR